MTNASILRREIFEQPDVIARLLDREGAHITRLVEKIRGADIDSITFAARGSSDNAAVYGKYIFAALNQLPVALATPSLYTLYHTPPRLKRTLVIAISQSGESPDILAVVAEARRQGAPTLALTNRSDSALAHSADDAILLHAGAEQSIAATKTYTASLAALALVAATLNGDAARRAEVERVPEIVRAALAAEAAARALAPSLANVAHGVVIGRGYNYATAFELALKLKELAYLHAEPYSAADFLHGPLALVDENFRALVIAPSGAAFASLAAFTARLRGAGARVIVLSDRALNADARLELPANVPEWLSPLGAIVPGQLLALHLALAKGYNVDQPRALTKVTRTL